MTISPRIIKKYANRRLYDTSLSSYITLDEVKTLVLEHVDFRVLDSHTQEDITKSTLLQIVNDHEETATPIFTLEVLKHLIRSYGSSMPNMLSHYLERSIALFVEHQEKYASMAKNPLTWMTALLDLPKSFVESLAEASKVQPPAPENKKNTPKKPRKNKAKNIPKGHISKNKKKNNAKK